MSRKLVISNKKTKDQNKTLKRLLSYMGRNKTALVITIIMAVVSTLGGLYGSYAVKPILNIISAGVAQTIPESQMYSEIARELIILSIVFFVEVVCMFYGSILMVKISQRVVENLREDMYYHMLRMRVKYHDRHTFGDLMSRFTNDIDLVSEGLNTAATSIVINILTLFGTIIIMFILSPILTFASLVMIPLLFIMAKMIVKKSKVYSRRQQIALGDLNGYIEEAMEGQSVIQLFNHENQSLNRFDELNVHYRKNAQKAQIYSILLYPLMANVNTISYTIIGILGGYLAIFHGLSVGDLGAYVNMTRQQGKPINEISSQLTILQGAIAAAERIFELLDWKLESWDKNDLELHDVEGNVRFENVKFGYTSDKIVLDDVTFWAKPNQKIAFVGSTGAGKTTITNLISKFYDIDSGAIYIDNDEISDLNRYSLRKHIAMVLQDTHLFTGTIMDNIRYGNLNATDEDCIKAAKLANADTFIRQLEHGYNTYITGDGEELSQGQKQLLNIARAAVANPSILILDEATSSIDTRTEKLVEKGMDSIMEGRTTFVIAHRLSTVRNADAILVLENGKIIERGSHDELLALGGRYASLYLGQSELS